MPSLTQQFVKEAERRILTGEWKVGEKIPPLRDLADEFHVSRSVVNAGIVELCNYGYLKTSPRRYICVSDWRRTGNFAVLSGLMENGLCNESFISDFLEGRMTIEKAFAKKAALARTDEDIAEIAAIIEKEKVCTEVDECAEMDERFHQALAFASHNVVYNVILSSFGSVSSRLVKAFYAESKERTFVVETHERLFKAVVERDAAQAEKIMEELLIHGENELKNILK